MDRCEECGFEYDLAGAPAAGPVIIEAADELAAVLTDHDGVRTRSDPAVWSVLEYGCHVRDVLMVQRERVLAARRTDRPSFDPMGRDERVEHDGYSEQEPADVARQLRDAARLFANDLARLAPDDWERTVMYNYPALFERSLRWVTVHTVHEMQHHLRDVRSQLGT